MTKYFILSKLDRELGADLKKVNEDNLDCVSLVD